MSAIPKPVNEPILNFSPGSPERASLQAKLKELSAKEIEIPLLIGGKEVRTGDTGTCVMPHNHGHVLARFHQAGPAEVAQAISAAKDADTDPFGGQPDGISQTARYARWKTGTCLTSMTCGQLTNACWSSTDLPCPDNTLSPIAVS